MGGLCNRIIDGCVCPLKCGHQGSCKGEQKNKRTRKMVVSKEIYKDNMTYKKRSEFVSKCKQVSSNELPKKQLNLSNAYCRIPVRVVSTKSLANRTQRVENKADGFDFDFDSSDYDTRVNTCSRVYKCSNCGGVGHNKLTCKSNSSSSDKSSDDVYSDPNSSIEFSNSSASSLHKESNNFQMGIDTTRKLMVYQIGVKFTSCTSLLKEKHVNEQNACYTFNAIITGVSTDKNFIIEALCEDGATCYFTCAEMLEQVLCFSSSPINKKRLILIGMDKVFMYILFHSTIFNFPYSFFGVSPLNTTDI